jgi:hypothetical protein
MRCLGQDLKLYNKSETTNSKSEETKITSRVVFNNREEVERKNPESLNALHRVLRLISVISHELQSMKKETKHDTCCNNHNQNCTVSSIIINLAQVSNNFLFLKMMRGDVGKVKTLDSRSMKGV